MSDSPGVPLGERPARDRAIETLEAIVSAFCKAAGDPIPQDAICTVARLRAENETLREALAEAKRAHYWCHPSSQRNGDCQCGASRANAKIDAALAVSPEPGEEGQR